MDDFSSLNRRPALFGLYETTLQENQDFLLTERFRTGLGEEVVMICLPDHAIGIYRVAAWKELQKLWLPVESESEDESQQRPPLFPDALFQKFDAEGYLFLTQSHCEWAGLASNAPLKIVGVGQRVEIWSQSEWDAYQAQINLKP